MIFPDLPPPETPAFMTKGGFAEHIGVVPGRVTQLIDLGMPVEPNGSIDVARCARWIEENIDPSRRRARLPGEPELPVRPKSEREIAETAILRIKAEKLAGNLLDRKTTLATIEARARLERDALLAFVNRAASEIARVTDTPVQPIAATLDKLIREHLASMASMPAPVTDE